MTALQPASRFDWERIVRRCLIPAPTKLVAYTLAQYGNVQGESIRPGVSRLAAVCGMGESTVRRHLDALQKFGLLERLANGGGPTKLAARYRLTIPEDLLERLRLLSPDELTPLNKVSGVAPVDNPELRSLGEVTPLNSEGNSAHPGERPSREQPNPHQGTSSSSVTSPEAWAEYEQASTFLSRFPDFGTSLIEQAPDEIKGWRERVVWAASHAQEVSA